MEMLEAEKYFFFPSSSVLSLSLPHLLSHDSSKKYFIIPSPPPEHHHNYSSYRFFSTVCPFSVFVFPPTASPDLQGSALALQETCWQRGRSWFLQLQLPIADSPCCQSDTLCLAFPRSQRHMDGTSSLSRATMPHTSHKLHVCHNSQSWFNLQMSKT